MVAGPGPKPQISSGLTAGLKACSTPWVQTTFQGREGLKAHSTPSQGSVAQGRLCSTQRWDAAPFATEECADGFYYQKRAHGDFTL
jgi:hypothetical protein